MSIQSIPLGQITEIDEGWIEIDQADRTITDFPLGNPVGRRNDQRRSGGNIPQGVLAPVFFFAQMPTMITPQYNKGVVGMFTLLQRVQDPSDLSVGKADGRRCAIADWR